ncbi:MAG: hypothetical protein P4L56_15865 [Candidatus Sulfopaludibacter sp.]|nr:hypothetical protein [Candidatus Sulfopaludibacter sp.]
MVRLLLLLAGLVTASAQPRMIESIVPALEYGRSCTSSIELRNLSERSVRLEVEAHRAMGGLVPLSGRPGANVELAPYEHVALRLEVEGESGAGWVKVREPVPPGASPAVAVEGVTECVAGDRLRREVRDVAFATRGPWFSGDVGELEGSELSLINTSDSAVTASGCYSSGSLFSNPGGSAGGELQPVCSASFHVQVPPFGTRRFPVRRENSSHFSVRTQGAAIVLQMLRPVDASVRLYKVDSSIQFGNEVTPVK